jgi:hypothetical protein
MELFKRTPKLVVAIFTAGLLIFTVSGPAAADGGGAAELAAKLQDPLANLAALMTDNTASFKSGPDHDDEAYEVNLQPVYSLNFPELGFTLIPRAMIPIVGVKPGTDLPRLGLDQNDEPFVTDRGDKGREWGLSDIVTQFFFTPLGQEGWKWGAGPMISWKTRTDTDVKGAGGGAGPVGVLVGGIGPIDGAILGGHLWGFDGDFSTTIVQPMLYYNIESVPGAYMAYNNTVAYDHKVKGGNGNAWTIPLGLTAGRTFDMGGGHGFDLGVGAYGLPSGGRPKGGAKYQVKLGLSWIFPR